MFLSVVRYLVPAVAALVIGAVPPAGAQDAPKDKPDLTFQLPIGCKPGKDCHLQNYMDLDSSRRAADYMCGGLTYDGSLGTEFRLPDFKAMEKGVRVYAAADGRIKAYRKNEKDKLYYEGNEAAVADKACGNSIILEHDGGWETQYCHLMAGTALAVRGLNVKAGTQIGLVGMSGKTKVPELQFLVRHNGVPVDPFSGDTSFDGCRADNTSMWDPLALQYLDYQSTGLVDQGFAGATPTLSGIEESAYSKKSLNASTKNLVYYVRIYGLNEGDIQEISILAPDGTEIAHDLQRYKGRSTTQFLRYIGQVRPAEGWQAGSYKGSYKLVRDRKVLIDVQDEISLAE